ncbi:MAG: hypothetical protein NOM71_02850 [Archaeoglobi archaeon]|nr:hypothetical protein [Archaeoglobi archaeon]
MFRAVVPEIVKKVAKKHKGKLSLPPATAKLTRNVIISNKVCLGLITSSNDLGFTFRSELLHDLSLELPALREGFMPFPSSAGSKAKPLHPVSLVEAWAMFISHIWASFCTGTSPRLFQHRTI